MSKARNIADLLDANGDVKSGALDNVPPSNDASALTTGTIDNARISLDANEIPNLDTAKITTGTFADARMPSTVLNSNVDLTNLSATNLTSGTLPDARFPSTLPAVSGANLTNLPAGGGYWTEVTSGTASGNTNINFTNLPSGKILKLFVTGKLYNPTIQLSNNNGSSYRTSSAYAYAGFAWRSDETSGIYFRNSSNGGMLDQLGWFALGSYGAGLEVTFHNLSNSTKASTLYAMSNGSHQRSNPETTVGWLGSANNTIETNNAFRFVTNNAATDIKYILLKGDEE